MVECHGRGHGTKVRHWLTLLSGFMESLCFSGIAYGWASLVFMLRADGYFTDHCVNATGEDSVVYTDCSAQDEQFSLVFCVASFSTNILRFPLGFFFDRYGTMAIRLLAIALFTGGTLFIALSSADLPEMLFPAMSCLSTSGMIFYMSNAQVGNLFEARRSTVITVYTGAFDSSAAVFLVIKLLHERGVSFHSSFIFLSSCSIFHLFRTFFLMPRGHIPYPLPENYSYGVSCPGQGRGRGGGEEERATKGIQKGEVKGMYETSGTKEYEGSPLQDKLQHGTEPEGVASFRSCVLSWFFLWHLLWVVVIQFCHFLFLATVNPRLNRLANGDQALVSQYTNAFALTQLCGVLCAPLNGLILDRHKGRCLPPEETKQEADLRSSALAIMLTSFQCFLFCVCFSFPILPLQYLTFALQVLNSSFIYGGHQAFVSIAFPGCHFGKLSGLMMSVSAMVLLFQFPVLHLIQHNLHGDPLYVNMAMTLLCLLTFIHPIHIHLHCRRRDSQRKAKQQVAEQ